MSSSEDLVSALLELTDQAAVFVDASGTIVCANEALAELLGRDRATLTGRPAGELLVVPHERGAFERWLRDLGEESSSTSRKWIVPAENVPVAVAWTGRVVTHPAEGKPCLLLTGRQCLDGDSAKPTESQGDRAALGKAVHRLLEVGASRGLALILLDSHAQVCSWSQSAESLLGWRESEVLGRTCPFLAVEDAGIFRERFQDARDGRVVAGAEMRCVHKSGERSDVRAYLAPFEGTPDSDAKVLLMLADIGPRMLIEEQLRESKDFLQTILDGLPAHLAVLDHTGLIIMVNEAWRRFAAENGLHEPSSCLGQNYLRVCYTACGASTEGAREAADGIQRIIQGRQKWFFLEYPCHSPDEERWFELRVTPYAHRERTGAIVAHVNVTERRQAERERTSLEAQLHQSQKLEAIGQLSTGVAHDFNNLLTAILGHLELAKQRGDLNKEVEATLSYIEQAARQAAGVTRSLLTFSRKLPVDKQHVDLHTVLKESVRLFRRMLPAMIQLEVEHDESEPIFADVDPNQIQQMIVNLALNARDAMAAAGTLTIGLARVPRSDFAVKLEGASTSPQVDAYARIAVSDTGMGMPPEVRARIFEPFYTTKNRAQGTGLGLAVVHGIVRDHEGHIVVTSEPDQGTTVEVFLPCADSQDQAELGENGSIPRAQGETVLLAEDNRFVRETTAMMLRSVGFEVMQVEDGQAFYETATQQADDIDLLIVDIDLPKRNGADCLRELRQKGIGKPAIGITGSGLSSVDTEGLEDFVLLRKPFQVSQIASLAVERLSQASRGGEGS